MRGWPERYRFSPQNPLEPQQVEARLANWQGGKVGGFGAQCAVLDGRLHPVIDPTPEIRRSARSMVLDRKLP